MLYLSLLENGNGDLILSMLEEKSRIIIKHEVLLLKCWLNHVEKQIFSSFLNKTHLTNQRVNFYKGLKQVINYMEGYLLLPSSHLAKIGSTANAHVYQKECLQNCEYCE